MAKRLTVTELLARIDELERQVARQFAEQDARVTKLNDNTAALVRCVAGLEVAQCRAERPSRSVPATATAPAVVPPTARVVMLHGVPHYKVQDAATRVVTYKPVQQ